MPVNRNQVSASAQTAVATAIALSQSLAGAGALTLNGALAQSNFAQSNNANVTNPGGPFSRSQIIVPSEGKPIANATAAVLSPPQNVLITSGGNDSGINWTIKGYDYGGSPISEVLAGANAGVATSALLYSSVTSITSSGATASSVTAGTGSTIYSPWLITGAQRNEYQTNVRAFIAAGQTATYAIQATSDINIMKQTGGYADDVDTLISGQTQNLSSYPNAPWMAYRLQVTAGGPVTLRILENRTA
jgi:hypothetical protein